MNSDGVELFNLVSILKLGPAIGIVGSSIKGDSKFISITAGSIKSSTILSVKVLAIVNGKGSNNFFTIQSYI